MMGRRGLRAGPARRATGAVRLFDSGSRSRPSLDLGHRPMGLAERSDKGGDDEPRDERNTDDERGCPRELTVA
jgi:hypothetical protein